MASSTMMDEEEFGSDAEGEFEPVHDPNIKVNVVEIRPSTTNLKLPQGNDRKLQILTMLQKRKTAGSILSSDQI
jgi:hypothetical protein